MQEQHLIKVGSAKNKIKSNAAQPVPALKQSWKSQSYKTKTQIETSLRSPLIFLPGKKIYFMWRITAICWTFINSSDPDLQQSWDTSPSHKANLVHRNDAPFRALKKLVKLTSRSSSKTTLDVYLHTIIHRKTFNQQLISFCTVSAVYFSNCTRHSGSSCRGPEYFGVLWCTLVYLQSWTCLTVHRLLVKTEFILNALHSHS